MIASSFCHCKIQICLLISQRIKKKKLVHFSLLLVTIEKLSLFSDWNGIYTDVMSFLKTLSFKVLIQCVRFVYLFNIIHWLVRSVHYRFLTVSIFTLLLLVLYSYIPLTYLMFLVDNKILSDYTYMLFILYILLIFLFRSSKKILKPGRSECNILTSWNTFYC